MKIAGEAGVKVVPLELAYVKQNEAENVSKEIQLLLV